jgi:ParB family chromosome partitioning protein
MEIQSIDPKQCKRWKFADRSDFEFGKIWELAEDIKRNGQIDPAIIRPVKDPEYRYEVIAGSRR